MCNRSRFAGIMGFAAACRGVILIPGVIIILIVTAGVVSDVSADEQLKGEALDAMKKAAQFMRDEVAVNGGYVWQYTPSLSRQWGEMEAYDTMIWVQSPGTVSMGELYLDAWHATGDPYFYDAAQAAADALVWGQLECGGWNYIIDFAGDRSLKQWYDTIGASGWRLEEFQHYYGNATNDDDVSSQAGRFLLKMYCENLDPKYKRALDNYIDFVLESQYPIGAWPQRYPLMYEFSHHGRPDYTSFYTFNDDVVWENVRFLLLAYRTLGEERFLEPIRRGMNFYIVSQTGPPYSGWGMQHGMDLKPASGRTYEPRALTPSTTVNNCRILMEFYRMTGETKYLRGIPDAIDWLESAAYESGHMYADDWTHPKWVDPDTGEPLYVHRIGPNGENGYYYIDNDPENIWMLSYGGNERVDVEGLREEYEECLELDPAELQENSPLEPGMWEHEMLPQRHAFHTPKPDDIPSKDAVRAVIESLDNRGRWLVTGGMTSNEYIDGGDPREMEPEFDERYDIPQTEGWSYPMGDKYDTSPYPDRSGTYITTREFIKNMTVLMQYYEYGE